MKIEIDISDDKLENLSKSANKELEKATKVYIEEILDEASRLEESRRINNSTPEITAAIVGDAVVAAKHYGIRKKNRKKKILIPSIAFISTIITGGIFEKDGYDTVWEFSLFLILFLIAIVSTLYIIFTDNSNE